MPVSGHKQRFCVSILTNRTLINEYWFGNVKLSRCRSTKLCLPASTTAVQNFYVKDISTVRSAIKCKLRKQKSCPLITYSLKCENCDQKYQTVTKRCMNCDSRVSESAIMLYKNTFNTKKANVLSESLSKLNLKQLPTIDSIKNHCIYGSSSKLTHFPSVPTLTTSVIRSTAHANAEEKSSIVDSSRIKSTAPSAMWLCGNCNQSNLYAVFECVACKKAKTEVHTESKRNDKNNNSDDNNNEKHKWKDENNALHLPKIPVVTNSSTAKNQTPDKSFFRRSCSDTISKSISPHQRFSLCSTDTVDSSHSDSDSSTWTCDRCSFAENAANSSQCSVCDSDRTSSECSITVTKNAVRYTPPKRNPGTSVGDPLRQSLKNDFQFLPADHCNGDEWICKKCTLLNADENEICVVCGGSKIRSLTSSTETTLKSGEFWTCPRCTLKNSLKEGLCVACKTAYSEISTSVKYNTNTGLYTTNTLPTFGKDKKPLTKLRRPLPRVPGSARPTSQFYGNLRNDNHAKDKKTWVCDECTYENAVESPSCEICQSSRTVPGEMMKYSADTFSKHLSNANNSSIVLQTHSKLKQQSELMENLRQNEEQEALVRWQQIVQYCREVCPWFLDASFVPSFRANY